MGGIHSTTAAVPATHEYITKEKELVGSEKMDARIVTDYPDEKTPAWYKPVAKVEEHQHRVIPEGGHDPALLQGSRTALPAQTAPITTATTTTATSLPVPVVATKPMDQKDLKEIEKDQEKAAKEAEKEHEKAVKESQKDQEKAIKEHEKELEKVHKAQKEADKEISKQHETVAKAQEKAAKDVAKAQSKANDKIAAAERKVSQAQREAAEHK
jgi:NADH dehydrogenase/NADH:ubiquinone oxidoreductase subunit G